MEQGTRKATILRPRAVRACAGSLLLFSSFLVPCSEGRSAAQEVQWRPDYNAARREAVEKNRPLMVDVGTENCFWCKRLDATTFHDPAVVGMINEQFIPVRIDASREPSLAEALGIQSYPTIVLATAEGKILKSHAGYVEAGPFHETLQQVLAALPKPKADVLVKTRPDPKKPGGEGGPAVEGPAVRWQQDYNVARRQAQEKNWPLVLSFGTAGSPLCQKQEATTLRDPAVVRLMNERFIPIKLDADKEAALARELRLQTYPTIVLAAPDGRILGTFEGVQEAARLKEYLQRAIASVANPEWMVRDYKAAANAIAASDYARAIYLLKSISEDGKDRPMQLKAKQLLQDLEQQAAGRLARASSSTTRARPSRRWKRSPRCCGCSPAPRRRPRRARC